ncbi:MAG: PAS-domain containing protein [Alphaproteobacteria bacterium]
MSEGAPLVTSTWMLVVVGGLLAATGGLWWRERSRAARLRAEAASAMAARGYYAALFQNAPAGLLAWDDSGAELWSDAAARHFAVSDNPSLAKALETLAPPDADALRTAIAALRQSGTPFTRRVDRQGGAARLLVCGQRMTSVAGHRPIDVVSIDDVTSAETAARQQAGLAGLLDALPVFAWRRSADGRIDYANRAFRAAVEAEPGLETETSRELAGAVGRSLARRAVEQGQPQAESEHVVVNGARRLLALTEIPLGDGGASVGFALDRTDVEEAQAELRRHLDAHAAVLEQMQAAIGIFDADTRLVFFNHSYRDLWGLDADWLRTEPTMGEILEVLRERRRLPEYADFAAFKRARLALFRSLIEAQSEVVHLPDGRTLQGILTPHPFGGLLSIAEDVTDRLTLERSYNTLIQVQRETLNNLHEGVAVFGADGRLRLFNPVFGKLWNLESGDLVGQPHIGQILEKVKPLFSYDGEWPQFAERVIARLGERDPAYGRIERTNGSVLKYSYVPLPDGATLVSYTDVTDTTRVERALRERNEALETTDRLKSEFIANVSYELRTPLNTILGFSESLAKGYWGPLNPRQEEYVEGIVVSSQSLAGLINDILDLASIEAGHMILDYAPIDMAGLLRTVSGLIRERARMKGVRVEVDCSDRIGMLDGDERRIKQALYNLLSNAVKFTEAGGSVTLAGRREQDEMVLSVTDNGIGIPDAEQARVFEKFVHGTGGSGRKTGAGLGLSLVKSLIELHGGHVALVSSVGHGTTVICRLPLAMKPVVAMAAS